MHNYLKRILIIFITAVIYYTIINALEITCPIKAVIGINCPACGVTRAVVSLLHFDFKGYIQYNAMAIPLISVLALKFFEDLLNHKKTINFLLVFVVCINFVYYFCRTFM